MIGSSNGVASGKWLPGAVLGAALLTGAAAVAPLPSFVPARPGALAAGQVSPPSVELPDPIDPGDWQALASKLEILRTPAPEVVKPLTPEVEVVKTPPEEQVAQAQPRLSPLGWTYKGMIHDNPPWAFIVMADGTQRFLRQGKTIDHTMHFGEETITVSVVSPLRVVLDRGGVPDTLHLDTTPTGKPGAMPGGPGRPPVVRPSSGAGAASSQGAKRDPRQNPN